RAELVLDLVEPRDLARRQHAPELGQVFVQQRGVRGLHLHEVVQELRRRLVVHRLIRGRKRGDEVGHAVVVLDHGALVGIVDGPESFGLALGELQRLRHEELLVRPHLLANDVRVVRRLVLRHGDACREGDEEHGHDHGPNPPCHLNLLKSSRAQFSTFVRSDFVQLLSGLKAFMAPARVAVVGPRSFSYTTPSWLTMNVITPETPYWAGYATIPKPPIIWPRTM